MTEYLEPVEKIARRWRDRLQISGIPEIEHVVSQFAEIKREALPIEADAIVVATPKTNGLPIIFLDSSITNKRETFTLAHELGHILIPWHFGTFVCTPTRALYGEYNGDSLYKEVEKEANRFAAEFLLPGTMVTKLFEQYKSPKKILEITAAGGISDLAASFKLARNLPSGFLLIGTDQEQKITFAKRTQRTFVDPPEISKKLKLAPYREMGARIERVPYYNGELIWVDFSSAKISEPEITTDLDSKQLIAIILQEIGVRHLLNSINGIVGAANSSMRREGLDLYTILTERFKSRAELQIVVAHPRFPEYLLKKAREIESRD